MENVTIWASSATALITPLILIYNFMFKKENKLERRSIMR